MLSLIIRDPTNSNLWLDLTTVASGVKFASGEHGYASLQADLALSLADAFRLYERPGAMRVSVFDEAVGLAWDGRLEDVAITDRGARMTALGYWQALADLSYTAVWAWTAIDGAAGNDDWREVDGVDAAGREPGRWKMWKHPDPGVGGMLLKPRKGNAFSNAAGFGEWTWTTPANAPAAMAAVTFNYTLVGPAGWIMYLYAYDRNWANGAPEWGLSSNGGTQSGTVTLTLSAPKHRLGFGMYYNSTSPTVYNGETGDVWGRIGQVSVRSTAAAVTSDVIVKDLIAKVAAANPTQLSASTMLVQAPGVTLTDELYEDQTPAAIATKLAGLGDSQTPPRQWEVGVWNDRRLHFRPCGETGRTWYVDVTSLELERSLKEMYNSAYATYQDPGGGSLRTGTADDVLAQVRWGITRRAAVVVRTTDATQAGVTRDAYLEDHRNPPGQAQIECEAIYDAAGGRWPLYLVRAGDVIVMRNLAPTLSTEVDRVRSFRIGRAEYACDEDRLTVEPEKPRQGLAFLLARREEGVS